MSFSSAENRTFRAELTILNFSIKMVFNSPFCVQAKIIKLVGLKNGGRLSPINLVTFAGTQNGEYR